MMKDDTSQFPTIATLVGKEVYLRPMESDDLKTTYGWFLVSDPQIQTCHQVTLTTPEEMAARNKKREQSSDRGDFIMAQKEDHKMVGKLSYFHLNMLNRSAELGYIVAPGDRSRGYAKEGMWLLIRYLFKQLNLNKVYAQTASFNKASIALLESLDFKLDGTLRQHHYYNGDLYDDLLYSLLRFESSF
ncbi:MAG: GNAT family N-acetyltransferase [Candidatus Zixiibacteriota bacterium]|nr:MAG: GNAT family N-acetyltransferase [candidate division Zixibacteria bacterium]